MKTIHQEMPRPCMPLLHLDSPYDTGFSNLLPSFGIDLDHEKIEKMKNTLHPIRARVALSLIGLAVWALVFFPAPVLAQGNGKTGKAAKPTMHKTLPEAQVTAPFSASLLQIAPHGVNVSLFNPTGKVVNVSIQNFNGNSVFREAFRGNEYHRTFNFSQIKSGHYSFCISGRKYFEKRPFKIVVTNQRSMVPGELMNQNASAIMATMYEVEPFKVRLYIVNKDRRNTEYLIRSKDKGIIHHGYTKHAVFQETFNMNSVPAGTYTFEVRIRGEKISRDFDIRSSEERSFVWLDKRGKPLMPAAPDYPSVQMKR